MKGPAGNWTALKSGVVVAVALAVIRDFKDPTTRRRRERRSKKVYLRSFSLYRDYSYPITLSNVGEPSWSWISRDHIQAQKEK